MGQANQKHLETLISCIDLLCDFSLAGCNIIFLNSPSLYHVTIMENNTEMKLEGSMIKEMETEQQEPLTVLSLPSAVTELKSACINTATAGGKPL